MSEEQPSKQPSPIDDKTNTTHLGELVTTESAMKHVGDLNEPKFLRLRKHRIYVPHKGGNDGRTNLYFLNCLTVRFSIFEDLRQRRNPPKFTQAMLGTLFDNEFGETDQHLINQLSKSKVDEIIESVISKYTRHQV